MKKVLVIDDETIIRQTLRDIFEYEGLEVLEAENGVKGLELLSREEVDLIFCDIKMPQMDGIEFLEKISASTEVPVVMISGHANIDMAVDAIKKGAYDFIEKPLDLSRILVTVHHALEKQTLVTETRKLKTIHSEACRVIGSGEKMQALMALIDKVAPTDARVLIEGANGTGKELVAKRIHELSPRKKSAWVEVNCAAIPSELIESELFGHEKGAFTSAVKQKKGSFEQADGGTLFLDEIGDMSLSAQAKVLRVLEENKLQRVGGEKMIEVNARVLAATNKDLKKEIEAGRFREDLYHRLSVIVLKVPDLKDRREDIPELLEYFLKTLSAKMGQSPKKIEKEAVELLQKRDWMGNVRELRNAVERLLILSDGDITVADVEKYI